MEAPVNFHDLPLEKRLELSLRSPAPFFVTGEDNLQLSALNSATGVTLTLAGRFMQLDGQVTPFVHPLIPTTNRVMTTTGLALGDGWVLNATIFASAGTPLTGQCWARLQVVRGLGGAMVVLGTLTSGYVTTQQPIAFPGGEVRGTLAGAGVIRSITGSNPTAGNEFSETVPTGARWKLLSVLATLVTDATVANRYPRIIIDDGATVLWRSDPFQAHTATTTIHYGSGSGVTRQGYTFQDASLQMPGDVRLMAGSRISSLTQGFVAGDNWAAPQLLVEEWLEGAA